MAVIFMDSFQHYATADLTKKWSSGVAAITAAAGRRGGNALFFSGGGWNVIKTFTANYPALIVGFAINITASGGLGTPILGFRDGGTLQCYLSQAPDGAVYVRRSAGDVALGQSAPGVLLPNVWAYVEIHAILHNTAGAIVVKVNGATIINLTGIDTASTANNSASEIIFSVSSNSFKLNDVYVIDPATAPNTTFLGDVRVDAYYPSGDGALSQWTPTPSGAHYATVDETTPNDTDYIEAQTAGLIDLFQVQDLAVTPGAFYAVQLCAAVQKTDAGSRQLKGVVRQGTTNYAGAPKDVSETQQYALTQFNTDPSTAVAWTKPGFDAAEFGVELV